MEVSMMVNTSMEIKRVMESIIGGMEVFTKDSGRITKSMVMESIHGRMEGSM